MAPLSSTAPSPTRAPASEASAPAKAQPDTPHAPPPPKTAAPEDALAAPQAPAADPAPLKPRPPAVSPPPPPPSAPTVDSAPPKPSAPGTQPAIAVPNLPRATATPTDKAPQIAPGDDVEILAAEHGFVPVPYAIPANTRFARLRLGMTKQDAEALLGRPDHGLHYANEGARIPFYASDDSSRWESFYRGQGRLMFSGAWRTGEVRLILIEYNPKENGRP